MAMAVSTQKNPYETSVVDEDRRAGNRFVSLIVVGFVFVLMIVVFYPVLDMATDIAGGRLSFMLAPLTQHICSRLLILLLMLLAIAGGLALVTESRALDADSVLTKRAMACGLLVNGVVVGIWVLADALHGFSTDHSTASEYARGFLCSTFIIAPIGGMIIFGPVSGIVRFIKRHAKNAK
jgi:hypothetical protein